VTGVAQLAPAHQRPDEEGFVEAHAVVTAVNGVLEEGSKDAPISAAGSKRSYSEMDAATEGPKLAEEPSSKRQEVDVPDVAGDVKELEQKGDAAVIAAAQELLKTSREKCRYQLEMMRTYQQRLFHYVQVNYKDGDQIMQCIPELETSRQTMNEYHTGASQTLEAAQLICREKRGVKLNTEEQEHKLEVSKVSIQLVENALIAANNHAKAHLGYKSVLQQLIDSGMHGEKGNIESAEAEAHKHGMEVQRKLHVVVQGLMQALPRLDPQGGVVALATASPCL